MASNDEFEALRLIYRPDTIRLLFVGESPPAGGTFFYKANSHLARCTQQAFAAAFNQTFEQGESFLRFFRDLGCYLDNLCLCPVNHLSKRERRQNQNEGIGPLATRIRVAAPQAIIVVMKEIEPYVLRAAHQVGFNTILIESLPFPVHGNQRRYVAELTNVLNRLQQDGILPLR